MTLEDAKKIYWKNCCSEFFLARGEDRCEEFRDLHIPRKTLEEWATEYLTVCIGNIKNKESWDHFSSALAVVGEHNSVDNLRLFTEMLLNLRFDDELSPYAVCYSLFGMRNLHIRCGILDYVKDTGDKDMFGSLVDYTKSLLDNMNVAADKEKDVEVMRQRMRRYI